MKVVRNPSVWAALSRVFSSVAGRATIDYIELTPLEIEELEGEYDVCFRWADDTGRHRMGTMERTSWGDYLSVRVREAPQDKHSRARRKVGGNGSERTR